MVHKICKRLAILISVVVLAYVSLSILYLFLLGETETQLGADRAGETAGLLLAAISWVIAVGPLALIAALTKPGLKTHIAEVKHPVSATRPDPYVR